MSMESTPLTLKDGEDILLLNILYVPVTIELVYILWQVKLIITLRNMISDVSVYYNTVRVYEVQFTIENFMQ